MLLPVYLTVTIDTECDKDANWGVPHPLTFRSVVEAVPCRLMPLFRRHGVRPTFLLSPEVMEDAQSVEVLRAIGDCELGTHLHSEFVEPHADWSAARTDSAQLQLSREVEREKLVNLTKLFEARFQRKPLSFRAGRFGVSSHTLALLAELGYRVDSSVTPFYSHTFEAGEVVDFWGAPLAPYYPESSRPIRSGTLPLLEVPVTIAVPDLLGWPSFALALGNGRASLRKRVLRRLGIDPKPVWFRPVRSSAEQLAALAQQIVARWRGGGSPVLNMMFHSNEVWPGASPYALTEGDVDSLLASLDSLFTKLRAEYDLRGVTLAELRSQW